MDPIALATLTSGVTLLATECAKGLASDAGKGIWSKISTKLGWTSLPAPQDIAPSIATKLASDDQLASEILLLLQQHAGGTETYSQLVSSLNATKAIVAGKIVINRDLNM